MRDPFIFSHICSGGWTEFAVPTALTLDKALRKEVRFELIQKGEHYVSFVLDVYAKMWCQETYFWCQKTDNKRLSQ